MKPAKPALSQVGAKGGALAMLSALSAYAVSGDPIALLICPILISVAQLLCLVEGPWTEPLMQRLVVRAQVRVQGGRRPRR
jgi:hypothetical protein